MPLDVEVIQADGATARSSGVQLRHRRGLRRDTSAEALAKLKPVFAANGSVTAGNSSPTSDGAAAVVVMSRERADALGLRAAGALRQLRRRRRARPR